ncbi:MAG: hypothetical protein MK105_18520 [Crocinitomicaceae bacterium]|nr:hypothetical protein [Crocinitomicaceae bacterium]
MSTKSKNKVIYLTVNDAPSGVYKSQVIDVVDYLNNDFDVNVQLVAFLPVSGFFSQKRKLKEWNSGMKVYPMFPRLKNWKKTKMIFNLFSPKADKIIARGPMAFEVAFNGKRKVIYDGRGAVKGELLEYPDMIPDKALVETLIQAEINAVTKAHHRIAVSKALVNYWQEEFGFDSKVHKTTVIPCLSTSLKNRVSKVSRASFNWDEDDIVLIYAGGAGKWQAFDRLVDFLSEQLSSNSKIKVLFMAKENEYINTLKSYFSEQVERSWVKPEEVHSYLSLGDYGILIREENKTNAVASPVKFGEYLSAGLKILVSPKLGDYSALVADKNIGVVVQDFSLASALRKPSSKEKEESKEIAKEYSKERYRKMYQEILES